MEKRNAAYCLSNSGQIVHYEKDITITPLGELFNKLISDKFNFTVVVSSACFTKSNISIFLKVRGLEATDSLGIVSNHTENDVRSMTDPVCRVVWQSLCDSIEKLGLPTLGSYDSESQDPYSLYVTIFNFVQRARFGYFVDRIPHLEEKMQEKYPDLDFHLRIKDDIQYYYLIFLNQEDKNRAEQNGKIEEMNNALWQLCREEDQYHVFDEPLPLPEVTTIEQLNRDGRSMGIMRNNPLFSHL